MSSLLNEQSLKRKNRLQQLRDRKKKQPATSTSFQGEVPATSLSIDSNNNELDQQLQSQHSQQESQDYELQQYNDTNSNNINENENINDDNSENDSNINIGAITSTQQLTKNTITEKPRKKLISRNYDRETNLPKNAFTSESLRMELENGQMVELVSEAQQGEILSRLSKKYDLDKDDEEDNAEDIDNYVQNNVNNNNDSNLGKIGKVRAILDFEEELQDQKKLLDRRTNKMIRQLLRERLSEMKKES